MKNPWMSVWLSEYNRHAGAVQNQIVKETARQQEAILRQQQEFVKDMAEQTTQAWLSVWFPWLPQNGRPRRK